MLNNIILAGRIVQDPEIKEQEGKKESIIILAVQRSYKNVDGVYETDFIPCVLYNGIADAAKGYCHKGDLVGVKGKIQSNENGIYIVAEKLTFLSSKKIDEK